MRARGERGQGSEGEWAGREEGRSRGGKEEKEEDREGEAVWRKGHHE